MRQMTYFSVSFIEWFETLANSRLDSRPVDVSYAPQQPGNRETNIGPQAISFGNFFDSQQRKHHENIHPSKTIF